MWPFRKDDLTWEETPICPYCKAPMAEMGRENCFDGKVNLAEDPKHCYRCRNEECAERPLYRRMDVEQGRVDEQRLAAEEARAQEHASFQMLNNEIKEITMWVRANRPEKLGSAPTFAEIVVSIMEESRA